MTSPADGHEDPPPAVAVSPADQSSDREQSDENNRAAVAAQVAATGEREAARKQAASDQGVLREQINAFSQLSAQHVLDLTDSSRKQTASNIRVAESYDKYAASMRQLQERSKDARRRYRVTIAVLVVFFSALLIRQEVSNRASTQTRDQIVDCLVPTGKCYQDSRRQQTKIVNDIGRLSGLAAACAPNYVDLPIAHRIVAIRHCIQRNLH